ncbi:sulfite exporter TauE/SafE family protein [Sphingobacterium rhinopitheci]|uniref:sulfite exporter TauE/SafE family protein n=1 Tax=Sphingobacterium rhinopitheci TaxID=2781960 RepID=UPI001F51A645|nr:sulfite exporter TauE/SafE family protein [Sphingobacterium rhinopitheci]MCI0920782.1 sulfite exporter TauE/SafE family protein [Sphingobacterium rhinopitheci]
MSYHYLAFFMGLFGSVHCAVMCGPLVIALQGGQQFSWMQVFNKVLYQLGRISMYAVLGALLGILGNVASFQGWQQSFSIITGVLLILFALMYFFAKKSTLLVRWQTNAIQPFARAMGKWLYKPGGSFVAGILNGILPCGMVYMALASAMNTDTVWGGAQFMMLFGVGTLPLMIIFSLASSYSMKIIKVKFTTILPLLFLIMGIWFILRGANLNIPYLSPFLHLDGALNCA